MNPGMKMLATTMARRRDSRGRYMEGDQGRRMEYGRAESNYNRMEAPATGYWPGPHIPPYLDRTDMARRMESGGSQMHEHPDGQNPYGGQPEVYRRQEERRSDGEMRRMTDGKTSGGEVNYNRPDGGYGNVSYFMHKADPLNQREGHDRTMNNRQIGFQSHDDHHHEKRIDHDTVMMWVQDMEDSDGVRGGKYTWHQAQQYANSVGITDKERQLEFYWAMNAMYADYSKAAKKFGVDKPEFYACMAKAFLEDPDAVEDKVEMYNRYIVRNK